MTMSIYNMPISIYNMSMSMHNRKSSYHILVPCYMLHITTTLSLTVVMLEFRLQDSSHLLLLSTNQSPVQGSIDQ